VKGKGEQVLQYRYSALLFNEVLHLGMYKLTGDDEDYLKVYDDKYARVFRY
jgi:hypothetical protein